jgi:phosphoglucosamine mutase
MTHPVLFGTDGMRGVAGEYPLQKPLLRKLGAAAADVYRQYISDRSPVFLLGRDTRGSGPWIAGAFAEGAGTRNILISDLGIISTPSLAHLVPGRNALGGVMISASHNPAAFNGVKLFGPTGRKCPDEWERQIEREIHGMKKVPRTKSSLHSDPKALGEYIDFLLHTVPPRFSLKGMTLVVDCGNGSMSAIAPRLLKKLGARVIAIGTQPNGKNINLGVGSQHPERMQRIALEKHADGGIAFDGDADRAIFCDEFGRILNGDYVLACAAHCLKEEGRLKDNAVVITVMANLGLVKALESWGIESVATSVGDRFVSDVLFERGYSVGGEQSGHIIFPEYLPTGDGLLTALQVLSMVRHRRKPLSWIYSLLRRYPQVLLNVEVKEKKPIEDCPEIREKIEKARQVLGDQGRVVVRYSGTEPLLRIMMEGPEESLLHSLTEAIASSARRELSRS